jgi:hypothetical protein
MLGRKVVGCETNWTGSRQDKVVSFGDNGNDCSKKILYQYVN